MLIYILTVHTGRSSASSYNTPGSAFSPVVLAEGRLGPTFGIDDNNHLTYGTYGCGFNILQYVWQRHHLRFEIDPHLAAIDALSTSPPTQPELRCHPANVPRDLFHRHHVDVFVADHSNARDLSAIFGKDSSKVPEWLVWLLKTPAGSRPRLIVHIWPSWALWRDPGPSTKYVRKPLERLGYTIKYRVLQATEYGSPVAPDRLIVVGFFAEQLHGGE